MQLASVREFHTLDCCHAWLADALHCAVLGSLLTASSKMSDNDNNSNNNVRLQKLQAFAAHGAMGVLSPGDEKLVPGHNESTYKVRKEQYERILAELQEELVKVQVRPSR